MDDQTKNETLPTATIADRVAEYLYVAERRAKMIFTNPSGTRFALSFDIKVVPMLNKMCGVLLHQWHKATPNEGAFFREAGEVSVSAFDEARGVLGIQFDGDIVHMLPIDTALKLVDIIENTVDAISTEAEKTERQRKKHPTIIQPRTKIITP